MRKYLFYIRRFIIGEILCDLVSAACLAVIPLITKYLFDSYETGAALHIVWILLLYSASYILSVIASYLQMLFIWKGSIRFETLLKREYIASLFLLPTADFEASKIPEYISILGNDIAAIEADYRTPLISIYKMLTRILVYGIFLFLFVDWRIAMVIMILSVLAVSMTNVTADELSKRRNTHLNQVAYYTRKVSDFLYGFRLISDRTRKNIALQHEKELEEAARKRYYYGKYKSFVLPFNGFFLYLIHIAAFGLVGYLLFKKRITVGIAVASIGYVDSFIEPINEMLYSVNAVNSTRETRNKLLGFFQDSGPKFTPRKMGFDTFQKEIRIENILLTRNGFTLSCDQIVFERGKKYAVIGPNGSGKSTLLHVLLQYVRPDTGTVYVDDRDLADEDVSRIFGAIDQDAHVYGDTYDNNLTVYTSFSKGEEERLFHSIPGHYIDAIQRQEDGHVLSGGEKQILALLRLMVSETPVLVMDEPFSAVDEKTSDLLQKTLLAMDDKTIVMTTHNWENLALFDEIVLLKGGEICKKGSYCDMENLEVFASLKKDSAHPSLQIT